MDDSLFEPIGEYHLIYYNDTRDFSLINIADPNRNETFRKKDPWIWLNIKLLRLPKYIRKRAIKIMLNTWTKEVDV